MNWAGIGVLLERLRVGVRDESQFYGSNPLEKDHTEHLFSPVSLPCLPVPRTMANSERTFIAIKPDGVQRGLVGEIIKRFEQKGFRLVGLKFIQVSGPHSSCFESLGGIVEHCRVTSVVALSPV